MGANEKTALLPPVWTVHAYVKPAPNELEQISNAAGRSIHFAALLSRAMDERIGIFIGQTSMQEREPEQAEPKCSP